LESLAVSQEDAGTVPAMPPAGEAVGKKGRRSGAVDQAIAALKMDRERLTENSESDPRYKSMKAVADIVKCSPSTLKGSVAFRKEWDLFLPYVRYAQTKRAERAATRASSVEPSPPVADSAA